MNITPTLTPAPPALAPVDHAALRDRAVELRGSGLSIPQIAIALDVPRSTVYSWLPKDDDDSRFAQMARMRESGMTNTQIGEAFGITRQRVSAVLGPSARRGRPAEKRTAVRVRLEAPRVNRLVAIAERLGIRIGAGANAGRGSINALLEEIATGNLVIAWKDGKTGYTHLIDPIRSHILGNK